MPPMLGDTAGTPVGTPGYMSPEQFSCLEYIILYLPLRCLSQFTG